MPRSLSRMAVMLGTVLVASVTTGRGDASDAQIRIVINGVDVTGLTAQKFEGCTVVFDDEGNLDITAPGYTIKKVEPTEGAPQDPASSPGLTQKHYYFWTENQNGSMVGDEYSLIVNGKVIKQFQSSNDQTVEDITPHLKPGTNQVVITAVKKDGYKGGSDENYFKIVIGEGNEENSKAVIEKTLHKFTRKASESEPGQSAYTLKAK